MLREISAPVTECQEYEQNCIMRSFMSPTLARYYWGDRIKKNEVERVCGTYRSACAVLVGET